VSVWSGKPKRIFCCSLLGISISIKFWFVNPFHQLLKETQKWLTLLHRRKKCSIVSGCEFQNIHVLFSAILMWYNQWLQAIVLCIILNWRLCNFVSPHVLNGWLKIVFHSLVCASFKEVYMVDHFAMHDGMWLVMFIKCQ
jgi:hypothetical protein